MPLRLCERTFPVPFFPHPRVACAAASPKLPINPEQAPVFRVRRDPEGGNCIADDALSLLNRLTLAPIYGIHHVLPGLFAAFSGSPQGEVR